MKGKCPKCKKIVDETEYILEKMMCIHCFEKSKREIINKVKALCEILEIDHLGLIMEGIERLMKDFLLTREYHGIIIPKDEMN